ncbi:MAG: Trk system potassium transporter TrkA [Alphaproteobacteria bacterium]|nr:Trk system potassium transporter TrkA [Alphaproteobacteria bacterium]
MRVIICGMGQVGRSIASYLSKEDNDVTVIDEREQYIRQIDDELDVNAIVGHASDPDVLSNAGAKDADLIIAVTKSDEINMVACQIGHSLFGIPKKIARIRRHCYLDPAWSNLFSRAHMPIDVIISPEMLVAQDIYQRLQVPGTTSVVSLAGGKAQLLGVVCMEDCPVLNTQLVQLKKLFPDLAFEIVSITRAGKHIVPDENDMFEVGDEAYVVVDSRHTQRIMAAFGHTEKTARRIIISGGGNIGMTLAKILQETVHGIQIKIIEQREDRAQTLSEELNNIVVLNGNTLDREVLRESSVETAETFIALMNNDENNILASLLAKQYGCERVITLVNNNAYYPLVGPLGIDVMVSPKSIVVANIMQHIRRGRIRGIHNLGDGLLEVIEAEVSDNARIVNKQIFELDLPREIVIGAVIREEKVCMPTPEFEIKTGDHVIIFTTREQASNVEKLFSVQVDLF